MKGQLCVDKSHLFVHILLFSVNRLFLGQVFVKIFFIFVLTNVDGGQSLGNTR